MLPLAGATFPASLDALKSALQSGFDHYGLALRSVKVESDGYPAIGLLSIDLSNAQATRELRVSVSGKQTRHQLTVALLEIAAKPLLLEGTPVRLRLKAKDVTLQHVADKHDTSLLTLMQASHGSLVIEIEQSDLEMLVQTIASAAAAQHGVEIKESRVKLTSRGPRALSFNAEITAKMFFVKAPITISGDLDIDDALDLHVSNLAVSGSGMAAGVAGNFIRPQFERIQRAPISLAVLALGEIKLRDVKLTTGETVRLEAGFGSV